MRPANNDLILVQCVAYLLSAMTEVFVKFTEHTKYRK